MVQPHWDERRIGKFNLADVKLAYKDVQLFLPALGQKI